LTDIRLIKPDFRRSAPVGRQSRPISAFWHLTTTLALYKELGWIWRPPQSLAVLTSWPRLTTG